MARNARSDARYADANVAQAFRDAVGDAAPKRTKDFERVCWDYELSGERVEGDVPAYLMRCVELEAFGTNLREYWGQQGIPADPLDPAPWDIADLGAVLAMDEWQRADDVLNVAGALVDVGAKLAYYLSGRVFTGARLNDEESPSEARSVHLWRDVRNSLQAGTTAADQFAYR